MRPKPGYSVKFTDLFERDNTPPSIRHNIPDVRLVEADIAKTPLTREDSAYTIKKDEAALSVHNKANKHADRVKKRNSATSSRRNSIGFETGSTAVGTPLRASPV